MSFHFANRFTSRSPVPFSGHGPFRPDSNPSRFALPLCAFNHAGNSRADSSPFTRNPVYLGRAVYENPPKSDGNTSIFRRNAQAGGTSTRSCPRFPSPTDSAEKCGVSAMRVRNQRDAQKPEKLRAPRDKMHPSAPEDFSKLKKNHLTQQIKYTFLVDIMKKDTPYSEFTERFASTPFRICRMRMRAAADCAFRGYSLFVSVAAEI